MAEERRRGEEERRRTAYLNHKTTHRGSGKIGCGEHPILDFFPKLRLWVPVVPSGWEGRPGGQADAGGIMDQFGRDMTLGPNFYIFSVLSPRICFCFVKQYCIAGIAAFFEILLLAVSKRVLKRS